MPNVFKRTTTYFVNLPRRSYAANPLLCVVTGMEHSGTTLLSQLLNSHPLVKSGFECGILMASPGSFHTLDPFWDWFCTPDKGWCLSEESRDAMNRVSSHHHAYRILRDNFGELQSVARLSEATRGATLVIDKTPAYVRELTRIMSRTNRPVVVMLRTTQDIWSSYRKRNVKVANFLTQYLRMAEGLAAALHEYGDRILVVRYASLAGESDKTMRRVAEFVGLPPPHDLTMDRYLARFGGSIVHGEHVVNAELESSTGFVTRTPEYIHRELVLEDDETAVWNDWHQKHAQLLAFIDSPAI